MAALGPIAEMPHGARDGRLLGCSRQGRPAAADLSAKTFRWYAFLPLAHLGHPDATDAPRAATGAGFRAPRPPAPGRAPSPQGRPGAAGHRRPAQRVESGRPLGHRASRASARAPRGGRASAPQASERHSPAQRLAPRLAPDHQPAPETAPGAAYRGPAADLDHTSLRAALAPFRCYPGATRRHWLGSAKAISVIITNAYNTHRRISRYLEINT
jgi:hypothetical protein